MPSRVATLGGRRSQGWYPAIDDYLIALAARGRSPGTIRLRRWHLGRVAQLLPAGPGRVKLPQLEQVLAREGWAPETRKSATGAVRGFYRWAHRAGVVDVDLGALLEPVAVPAGLPRPCPETVVREALAAAEPRVRLMILLAAYGGLRCCEIARVHYDGLGETHRLRVVGKGGKVRLVPIIEPELIQGIRAAGGWVFPGPRGPMTPGHVTKLLSRALPDGWTGHTLRHRMATRAYAGTRDPFAVGKVLGHSRPETTLRYVLIPDDALVAAVLAAA